MEASASLVSKARMLVASVAAWAGVSPARVSILVMWATYCCAELLILVAGAGVVVALGEAETALVDDGDLLAGVLEVLLFAEAEEDVDAVALELAGEVRRGRSCETALILSRRGWRGARPFFSRASLFMQAA